MFTAIKNDLDFYVWRLSVEATLRAHNVVVVSCKRYAIASCHSKRYAVASCHSKPTMVRTSSPPLRRNCAMIASSKANLT